MHPCARASAPRQRLAVVCMAKRRRMIIKQRTPPTRAQRKKLRYRDAPAQLDDIDRESPRYAGRLTSEINSVNGPLQLARLVQEHGLAFSGAQASMALSRLAAFATFLDLDDEQRIAHARATRRCVLLLRERVAECDALSHARAVYSLGRLRVADPELLTAVVAEVDNKLNLFLPDGLAALIAGLAALQHAPPPAWLDRFCLEVYTRFTLFQSHELASIVHALARLRFTPSTAWMQRCLECFRTTTALPPTPLLPPALVKFAFATATLQVRPSFNWTTAFVARVRPHLDALNARELPLLLWALSRMLPTLLAQQPAAGGGAGAGEPGRQQQPVPSAPAPPNDGTPLLVASVPAGVVLAAGVDRPFLEAWYRCTARRMPYADAPSLVLALQALVALQATLLPQRFVAALLARLKEALEASAQRQQAAGGPHRGEEAEEEEEDEEGDRAGTLSGEEAVSVLLCLVALRIRPGPEWMDACLQALRASMGSLSAPMLADLLWALARLQYQPPGEWVAAFLARCRDVRAGFAPEHAQALSWAMGALRVTPPPQQQQQQQQSTVSAPKRRERRRA